MTGETSWTECATQVMAGKEQAWFTVQAIVTEIREKNMKPSMHRLPANEACRSLRSCLRHHAMKDNGKFVRKHSNSLILYALRKGVHSKRPRLKRSSAAGNRLKISSTIAPISPPSSSPYPSCTPPMTSGPFIVEVDNPNIPKPYRPRHPRDSAPPGFLLPSPSLSLLAARRMLSLLCAGESGRPVRKTRGRGRGERAIDHTPRSPEVAAVDSPTSRQDVFGPEMLCSVEAYSSNVVFLKSSYDGSPVYVQGDREGRVLCEVDPNLRVTSDLSSSSSSISSSGDSETETCSEEDDTFTSSHISRETTPTNDRTDITSPPSHHDNKSSLIPHKAPPTALTTLTAGRRSEVARRQLAHLLSSSSPLVGENLKVLLGPGAYEGLSTGQRQQLMSLLPPVDMDSNRIQPVALSNSFFGSACREWQDHLTLGLHGNTGGRGARVEKKARIHDNTTWKCKFFESNWGERLFKPAAGDDDQVFFPCEPDPTNPLTRCLHAVVDGYCSCVRTSSTHLTPPPPPPPPLPPPLTTKPSPEDRKVVADAVELTGDKCSVRLKSRPPTHRARKPAVGKEQSQQLYNRNSRHKPPSRRLGRNNRNNVVLFNKKVEDCMYLSPLPHKMSYSALLEALHKASRHHSMQAPSNLPSDCPPHPLAMHSNPVFLDHFSTLHSHSVPANFLSSPPSPPSSLPVSLPRSHYAAVLAHRAVLFDHNYTPVNSDPLPTLPLSLPRSLLPPPSPHTSCECSSNKLTFCSTCNSLYHVNCSHGNLCPSCLKKPSLT